MKKTLQILFALLITATVSAQTFDDGTFTYNVIDTENNYCEITGWVEESKPTENIDLEIPGTVNNMTTGFPIPFTVTQIGDGAFSGGGKGAGLDAANKFIQTVTLPSTITTFVIHTFRDNPNLTSINLEHVVDLGSNAFTNCTGLSGEINLPVTTNLGAYPFFNCPAVTALNAPLVENCDAGAYYNMKGVKEFDIPASLMNFGALFLGWNDALVQVQLNWDATQLANVTYNTANFFRGEDFANTTKKIYVPEGSKSAYEAHELWGQFPSANIIEGDMPELLSTNKVSAEALGFSVYPNPTNGLVSIKNSQVKDAAITVYDVNGRALLNQNINTPAAQLNLTGLSKGIYILRVQADNSEFTKRIVKQ